MTLTEQNNNSLDSKKSFFHRYLKYYYGTLFISLFITIIGYTLGMSWVSFPAFFIFLLLGLVTLISYFLDIYNNKSFTPRKWVLFLYSTVFLLVIEIMVLIILGSATCVLGKRCFGGGNPNYSPFLYYTAWGIGWVFIITPIVATFLFLRSKVGGKSTIKLFSVYIVLGFLFYIGQIVGMEEAWKVILLLLIAIPTMYYWLFKY